MAEEAADVLYHLAVLLRGRGLAGGRGACSAAVAAQAWRPTRDLERTVVAVAAESSCGSA